MAIQLIQLKKQYVAPDGSVVPVIDIQRFELADGEQMALVGTSGSGKTTLLHLIAGILTPDSGQILFGSSDAIRQGRVARRSTKTIREFRGGFTTESPADVARHESEVPGVQTSRTRPVDEAIDLAGLSEADRDVFRGRNIGYIFQTHHLLPGFTALENVLLGMTFGGGTHDPAWAKKLLNEVGLSERLNYRPNKLSVGQQQRVAIARALANRPKLVLADEPTGSLDASNAQQALDLIRKLCTEVGAALLLVSHDPHITQQMPRSVVLGELNRAAKQN